MSSLSSYNIARLNEWDKRFLEEDEQEEIDENGLWLEADRKGEEEWAERYLTSLESSRFCMN